MAFTYFLRDGQTLDLIAQHVIPDLRRRRYIDVWDAGCATGAETYSLAIVFRENMGRFLFRNLRIWATDIDESNRFGAIIARGAYADSEVRRIPETLLARYFRPSEEPGCYVIEAEIRRAVSFAPGMTCSD
jgi:chemotaxis protein methyltransferase CheR